MTGARARGEPEIIVAADENAASDVAAHKVAEALAVAVAARGRADWVTTGGSTPTGIYHRLAVELRDALPWDAVHVWWGDDRYVPRDHPMSNVLPVDQVLIGAAAYSGQSGRGESGIDIVAGIEAGVPIPVQNLHPIPMAEAIGEGRGPAWAAARYDGELRGRAAAGDLAVADGFPVFDLALVGMGRDGHVLSVFPDSPTWDAEAWAIDVPAPTHVEPHVPRVTLHPAILGATRQLLAVAHGSPKAQIVATVLGPRRDPKRWPVQAARREGATWILDTAAAAYLDRRAPRD